MAFRATFFNNSLNVHTWWDRGSSHCLCHHHTTTSGRCGHQRYDDSITELNKA